MNVKEAIELSSKARQYIPHLTVEEINDLLSMDIDKFGTILVDINSQILDEKIAEFKKKIYDK